MRAVNLHGGGLSSTALSARLRIESVLADGLETPTVECEPHDARRERWRDRSAVESLRTASAVTLDSRAAAGPHDAFDLPSDPLLFLIALDQRMGRQDVARRQDEAVGHATQARSERYRASVARKRAEQARRKAHRCLRGAPRWLKRIVSAVITAAGVAGAAVTGGASLGLAIAGATLTLGADGFAKLAEKLGASPRLVAGIRVACSVAGSALSLGSGAGASAASAASAAAGRTAEVVRQVRQVVACVQSALGVVDGTREIGGSVHAYRAQRQELAAEAGLLSGRREDAALEHVLDAMRSSLTSLRERRERAQTVLEARRTQEDATAQASGRD